MWLFPGLKNPLTLMSYVAPVMTVATALLSLLMDPWYEFKTNNYFNSSWHVIGSCLLMLIGGTLAFFMVGILTYFHWIFSIGLILFIYLLLLGWALTLFGDTVFDDLFSGFTYISCCCLIILGNLFGIPLGLNKPGLSFCSFLLLQVLTEYILVSVTSAVTVTIAGVVKEAVTILVWAVVKLLINGYAIFWLFPYIYGCILPSWLPVCQSHPSKHSDFAYFHFLNVYLKCSNIFLFS